MGEFYNALDTFEDELINISTDLGMTSNILQVEFQTEYPTPIAKLCKQLDNIVDNLLYLQEEVISYKEELEENEHT